MNILLVTLDQFRGDCLSALGHPLVRTPNLDALAREGTIFARHYGQSAPCSPGRASLYTGMYQMNHRVVANGTPLDARFDNIAKAARRAGYAPALFGYTDQSIDPRQADGPSDPRLSSYEGVLPGFDEVLRLVASAPANWTQWLEAKGYDLPPQPNAVLEGEPSRPVEHSMSAFLADGFIAWVQKQERPWFAHLSQFRPHPPYAAAGDFSQLYDPRDCPAPIAPGEEKHWLHAGLMRHPLLAAPSDPTQMARLRGQYFGMASEADHQFGRVVAALKDACQWDDTFIVVTADHGDQLGDHGLMEKLGFFEASYHIPCIVRDPRQGKARGAVVGRFTEAVDVFPTLCEAMGLPVPLQCDGLPLTPFLNGIEPPQWRAAAHWEFDWRFFYIASGPHDWPWDRRLERQTLAVRRSEAAAYVHFGDGASLAFDLSADPTWRTRLGDPASILREAEALLAWRAQHLDRTLTGMLVEDGGIGRWPPLPDHWHTRTAT